MALKSNNYYYFGYIYLSTVYMYMLRNSTEVIYYGFEFGNSYRIYFVQAL